jgi:hypothetical protein
MLHRLLQGEPTLPHNKGKCILVQFEGEPHILRSGQIDAFAFELEKYFDMKFHLTGIEDRCILTYYRPEMFTKSISKYIRENMTVSFMGHCSTRFGIVRADFYGRIFTLHE